MPFARAVIALCALVALAAPQARADDPFYKGKRLILIINFAAGGPSCSNISTVRPASSCRTRTAPAA